MDASRWARIADFTWAGAEEFTAHVDQVDAPVSELMVKVGVTVGEIADFFNDDHAHAASIVTPTGYLAAVQRADITGSQPPGTTATRLGQLAGRVVLADANLTATRLAMNATGRRRAPVIGENGELAGLLCLKANRAGFCSEHDVRALDQLRSAAMTQFRVADRLHCSLMQSSRGEPAPGGTKHWRVASNNGRLVKIGRAMSAVIFGAIIAILAGLFIIWLSIRMWRERLPRNPVAGVRTRSAMRTDETFRIANQTAAPLSIVGGVVLIAGGLVAAFLPKFAGATRFWRAS